MEQDIKNIKSDIQKSQGHKSDFDVVNSPDKLAGKYAAPGEASFKEDLVELRERLD